MSSLRNRPSIDALTSLRGIAALLVIVNHMGLLMLPLGKTDLAPALTKCGPLGMTIFFVLSGFVIHYNYSDRLAVDRERGVTAFLFARFARLYPLYLPVILVNYVANMARAAYHGRQLAANVYSASLPVYLAGMQSWFYSTFNGFNLSISQELANNSWSISVELFLYLLFIPLALWGGFKRHALWRGVLMAVAAIVGRVIFIRLADSDAVLDGFTRIWGTSHAVDPANWLIYYSPYGRIFEFIAGVGVAEVWLARNGRLESGRARLIAQLAGAIAIVYIAASFLDGSFFDAPRLFGGYRLYSGYVIAVPLAVYAVCRSKTWLGKFACTAPLMFVGEISYSLYLLHGNLFAFFIVKLEGNFAARVPEMLWKSAAFLAILFAVASLIYRFLEIPARRWILNFYRKSMIQPALSPASTTPER